jgi:hypothetical protein
MAGRSEAMSRKSSVHEISPRLATKGRARGVRYPVPNPPPPSAEEYAQTVKEGVSMLRNLLRELEYYQPCNGMAGTHLANEVRSRLAAVTSLLVKVNKASGKGENGVQHLFMYHLAKEEERHREHIRIDMHNVLSEVCRAVEERMRKESQGYWRADTRHNLLRMMADANKRMAEKSS